MTTATYHEFTGSAAARYEQFFVPAIATPVSAELLAAAALQAGEKVVDVACGTGVIARLAAAAAGEAGSVAAVDLAPDMIEVAAAMEPPPGAQIRWYAADARSIPLPDQSHDVVLCQMGLMFMEDRSAALAEMRRILKPGGRVVVNTPGPILPPFQAMERALVEHIDPGLGAFVGVVFSMHDAAVVGAALGEAGFDDVVSRNYVAQFDLPAPAEFLWQYIGLTPMAPLVAGAPAAAKAAMEAQVVEACAPWVEAGRIPLAQPMVLVSARRT